MPSYVPLQPYTAVVTCAIAIMRQFRLQTGKWSLKLPLTPFSGQRREAEGMFLACSSYGTWIPAVLFSRGFGPRGIGFLMSISEQITFPWIILTAFCFQGKFMGNGEGFMLMTVFRAPIRNSAPGGAWHFPVCGCYRKRLIISSVVRVELAVPSRRSSAISSLSLCSSTTRSSMVSFAMSR